MPGGKRVKSYSSASAQCTIRCGGGSSAASPEARSRSSSMTSKCPTNFSKCLVSAPSPGPISTMKSVFDGLMACTRRASTPGSCRKCWPKRLRGRCELDRKLGRLDQAARVGLAGSGDLEVLASEMPRLAAVRVEPGDENARSRDAETPPQVGVEDAESSEQIFRRDCARHLRKRQMGRRQRDAQSAADQHHHDVRGLRT